MKQFCIVVMLKGPLAVKVRKLQCQLSRETNSTAGVRWWKPHLTVGSGIIVSRQELPLLKTTFRAALEGLFPFPVHLRGYGFMNKWPGGVFGKSPYVVYVKVQKTKALGALVAAVKTVTQHHPLFYKQPAPYTPHVTLAFSDLSRRGFEKAKALLQGKVFTERMQIDHVALLRKNARGEWGEYTRFPLR